MSIRSFRLGRQPVPRPGRLPPWLLLWIPLALICGAGADIVEADLPEHDWPANTLTLLSSDVAGLRRQPLSASADGAGGLWIAARGELVRWTSLGISEHHLAARTAWMVATARGISK